MMQWMVPKCSKHHGAAPSKDAICASFAFLKDRNDLHEEQEWRRERDMVPVFSRNGNTIQSQPPPFFRENRFCLIVPLHRPSPSRACSTMPPAMLGQLRSGPPVPSHIRPEKIRVSAKRECSYRQPGNDV